MPNDRPPEPRPAARATPAAPARFLDSGSPPRTLTLVLMTGLAAMSMNVFLPSLPGMAAHFETDYSVMQLSVTGYLIVTAVLNGLLGPISDRYGRRPVVLAGYVTFLLATLGCLWAPTIGIFLAFRLMQAFIVAGMLLSRATIRDQMEPAQAASAIAYVTMGTALVPMISPALGGLLDQTFGWKAVFWALFVVGLAITWLGWRDWGETAPLRPATGGPDRRQYRELFRARRFWGYVAANTTNGGAFFAYIGGAPYVGAELFGLLPSHLGLLFAFTGAGYIAGNYVSARWTVRVGIDRMVLIGSLITVAGVIASMAIMATPWGSALSFFGFMGIIGAGNGLVLPNATAGMMSVRPHLAGTASGIGGALMIGGGAMLSALTAALLGPGTGAWPLLWIQLVAALGAVVAIVYVIRRERQLRGR